ncbi:MAG: DMT family transporter, partial [Saccharofermentanales bacterium]
YAVLAAVFYAINMPLSKMLLRHVEPAFMASFLYFGAGIGIGILYLAGMRSSYFAGLQGIKGNEENLSQSDLPFTLGMIVLDIAAPILLMAGLMSATSANASLLNNFEIVATMLIALLVFREVISPRLWGAIVLVFLSSVLLSFEDLSSFRFSAGSMLVLAAAACWGLENNLTRKIASKNTFQIVTLKGIFSGFGSFVVALLMGDRLPQIRYVAYALLLGFVAYGLSIFLYVKAQKELGAAKTSAFYAIAPFVGAMLSFAILREPVTGYYPIALVIMIAGSALAVADTLLTRHVHLHTHIFVHTHDGSTHSHAVDHAHPHKHLVVSALKHAHPHKHLVSTLKSVHPNRHSIPVGKHEHFHVRHPDDKED